MDQTVKPRAKVLMQAVETPIKPLVFKSTGDAEDDEQLALSILNSNKNVDYVTKRNEESELKKYLYVSNNHQQTIEKA